MVAKKNSTVKQFEGMVSGFNGTLGLFKKNFCCQHTEAQVEEVARLAVLELGPAYEALELAYRRFSKLVTNLE